MFKSRGTILIVDDEKAVRALLNQRLKSEGYRCEEVGNADDALTCLGRSSMDLVLLDIKMPGKSGMELLPEIKERHRDVVVITATDASDMDTAIESVNQGAYDYLT